MLEHNDKQAFWREYMATVAWSVGRVLGGDSYAIPAYGDIMNPQSADTRNQDQIVNDLIQKLKGKEGTTDDRAVPGSGETGT